MELKVIFAAILILILGLLLAHMSLEGMTVLPPTPGQLPSAFVGSAEPVPGGPTLPGGVSRVLTLHFAPWCGACTNFKPTWENMKRSNNIAGLTFQENNEEANPTPGIRGYPTIAGLDEWGRTYIFRGDRSPERILEWISMPTMVG